MALCQLHCVEGLGQRTNLVHLHEQSVSCALFDTASQTLGVGHEQVVTDDLDLVTDLLGQGLVALPVVLVQGILDGNQGVLCNEVSVVCAHLSCGLLLALELVCAVVVELGGCNVQCQCNLLARLVASLLDCLNDQVQCSCVGLQVGCETTLVAQAGCQAAVVQHGLQGVVNLNTCAQSVRVVVEADGSNHELLDVNVGVCVRTTVEDVHHGDGQNVSVRAAEVLVQGQVSGLSSCLSNSQGDTQDCVCAQLALVVGCIQSNHGCVNSALVGSLNADDLFSDFFDNRLHCTQNALAQVYGLVAVAALNSFPLTGGCARGHSCACESTVFEQNLNLNGRVATGIQDLACVNCGNNSHELFSL